MKTFLVVNQEVLLCFCIWLSLISDCKHVHHRTNTKLCFELSRHSSILLLGNLHEHYYTLLLLNNIKILCFAMETSNTCLKYSDVQAPPALEETNGNIVFRYLINCSIVLNSFLAHIILTVLQINSNVSFFIIVTWPVSDDEDWT